MMHRSKLRLWAGQHGLRYLYVAQQAKLCHILLTAKLYYPSVLVG